MHVFVAVHYIYKNALSYFIYFNYLLNANKSLNAKICPKIVPGCHFQFFRYIASVTYNISVKIYVQILQAMRCKSGQQLYNYTDKEMSTVCEM